MAAETMMRSTVGTESDYRFAILGLTSYTNVEVGVSTYATAASQGAQAVVARFTDPSNYLMWRIFRSTDTQLALFAVSAGATVISKTADNVAVADLQWYNLRLVVFTSGRAIGSVMDKNGAEVETVQIQHSSLATGGALATGKIGFADYQATSFASTRYYDDFYSATPPAESIVCYSGQSIQFRNDGTLREDATGTYWGPPAEDIGSRFYVPSAGGPNRKARVAVMARRFDIETNLDDDLTSNATTDSTTVDAYVTPRYLAVPR